MKSDKNLDAAISWLLKAQDVTQDGGVSKYYTIGKGWCKESYQEVSGYIIPTLLDLYEFTKKKEYFNRAKKIADWLVEIQDISGKWEYVFDTGQVLLGLTDIYNKTREKKYLDSIIKASDWLVNVQERNGNWAKGEFALGIKNKILRIFGKFGNSHNTRTAWALLKSWQITKNPRYKNAAIKNLNWAVENQLKNGYYRYSHTYLHYLVYTASGLLESGIILKNENYINSAKLFADNLLLRLKRNFIPQGNYNEKWNRTKQPHSALTSDAQFAILLYQLFKITKNKTYKQAADSLINFVRNTQNLSSNNPGIYGGIAGSSPSNGAYCPNMMLSWAAKFYIDALLIQDL